MWKWQQIHLNVTKDSISVLSVPSVWRQRSGLTSPDVEVTADTFKLLQKILFLSWAFRLFEDSVQVWRHLMWKWQQIHLNVTKDYISVLSVPSVWRQRSGLTSPDVEVLHVDVPVGGRLPLTPQQQTLFSRRLCGGTQPYEVLMSVSLVTWAVEHVRTLHRNVLDSETENDGPDHSESHFQIAINNLCRARERI